MENEIRYYLSITKKAIEPLSEDELANLTAAPDAQMPIRKVFVPTYLVTAVKLPTGAIELAVNTQNIAEKIDYILEAYDENMQLKTNPEIIMQNVLLA